MKNYLRYFALLIVAALCAACQPAEYDHCIVNDSDQEITIEFKGAGYAEDMNTAGYVPSTASLDDFNNKKPWRSMSKVEYDFATEPVSEQTPAQDRSLVKNVFRVKLAAKTVLRLFRSSRLSGDSSSSNFLSVAGKSGKIRLEGRQTVEQFKSYARNWFSLESNPYVVWYE